MPAFPELFILRHGETEWNLAGRLQGRFDAPLTANGIRQARTQREILQRHDLPGFRAVSSPQGRALQTARLALKGLLAPIHTEPALSEIGLGAWAGRVRAEVMAESGAEDSFALYELAPDGEGFGALRARCESFLRALDSPAVLITHGITSRMLRLILTGRPISALRDAGGGQGMVFYVENGVQYRLTIGA